MRLLFVAADRMEYSGIMDRAKDVRHAGVLMDWARTATVAGNEALLVANGAGSVRAAAAVEAGSAFRPDAIVSIGYCGALDERMEVSDIVVGTAVLPAGGALRVPDGGGGHHGPIYCLDHVARTAEEKRELRARGACAVEMEAAGVLSGAQRMGVPVYCVKSVTDLAGETLANDFNAALRGDGHFDTMLILRKSLRHPAVRLPELLRLRNRCARAARALGAFFADCRF